VSELDKNDRVLKAVMGMEAWKLVALTTVQVEVKANMACLWEEEIMDLKLVESRIWAEVDMDVELEEVILTIKTLTVVEEDLI